MSQVSKRYLPREIQERMYDVFWQSLTSCSTKEITSSFLEDLLTPTEKIMLAKRVSIAFLLLKGYDYGSINQTLRVSNPTIWIVNLWLKEKGRGYRMILEKIINSEKMKSFWQEIEKQVEDFLPPKYGINWSEARRKQWETRKKQQKAF